MINTCASCGELSSGSRPSPVPSLVPCGWGEVLPRLQGSMSGPLSPSCWMSVVRLTDIFLGKGRGWELGRGLGGEPRSRWEKKNNLVLAVLNTRGLWQFDNEDPNKKQRHTLFCLCENILLYYLPVGGTRSVLDSVQWVWMGTTHRKTSVTH